MREISFFCLRAHFFVVSGYYLFRKKAKYTVQSMFCIVFLMKLTYFQCQGHKKNQEYLIASSFSGKSVGIITSGPLKQYASQLWKLTDTHRFWGCSHKWKIKDGIKFTQKSVMPLNSWNMIFKISWV